MRVVRQDGLQAGIISCQPDRYAAVAAGRNELFVLQGSLRPSNVSQRLQLQLLLSRSVVFGAWSPYPPTDLLAFAGVSAAKTADTWQGVGTITDSCVGCGCRLHIVLFLDPGSTIGSSCRRCGAR